MTTNASQPEQPMRVSHLVIERCRQEIDAPWKKLARKLITPIARWYYGFEQVGEGFQFGRRLDITKNARIGRYVYLGTGFEASSPIVIGDLCMLSTHVKLVGNDHGIDDVKTPIRLAFQHERKTTILEADVWVGKSAIIFAGARIGRGAVIASGAVVTRDVEPYTIVAGVPARVVRTRFSAEQIEAHEKMLFKH